MLSNANSRILPFGRLDKALGPAALPEGGCIVNSLKTDRVAGVLTRLYEEAETADRPLAESFDSRNVAQEEGIQEFLKEESKDYKALYRTYAGNFLNIS